MEGLTQWDAICANPETIMTDSLRHEERWRLSRSLVGRRKMGRPLCVWDLKRGYVTETDRGKISEPLAYGTKHVLIFFRWSVFVSSYIFAFT